MEIIKDFYKKRQLNKIFYAKAMKVRSSAYGEDVRREFIDWQSYFFERRKTQGNKFVLSELENLFGDEWSGVTSLDKALAPLSLDGYRLELYADGYVYANGRRTSLYVGKEIKAGALFYIPTERDVVSGLAVIGKPSGTEEMRLSVYFWRKGDFDKHSFDFAPLAATLEASSHLFCLGRHIFLMHNSVLDYYYLNVEEERLERVAIGEDGANDEFPWCKFVAPCLVTNGLGDVFWIADQNVYTFPIGYPKKLANIKSNKIEEPIHLFGTQDGVNVYKKQRGTNTVTCAKYQKVASGRYLVQSGMED